MKNFILSVLFILTMFIAGYAESATTSDGAITLNFYEDTQSGIENRWILDMTLNDFDGPGGVEEVAFNLWIWTNRMSYENNYNPSSDYYVIGGYFPNPGSGYYIPAIATDSGSLYTPVGTNYLFYALPNEDYLPEGTDFVPIIGNFDIDVNGERIQFTGPVGFAPVPEPMSMVLFAFGAFLLKFITKRK